jgi:phosphoribosylaminoimidazole-succinocarboxamide synthase
VMGQPIPGKGELLTRMALFWFDKLSAIVPNHLTGDDPEGVVADSERDQVRGRSMLVKRLTPLPIEAVVRGYLAGSAWQEYSKTRSVCGIDLPAGLQIASKLSCPIFTPATKANIGDHDENITFEASTKIVGGDLARRIKAVSLELYSTACSFAIQRGVIIADTKFEFGLDADGRLTLMDEILTPDSSRFWPVQGYATGSNPPSFDKQYIRDWLEQARVDGKPWNKRSPAPRLSDEVIEATSERYREALARLVGRI